MIVWVGGAVRASRCLRTKGAGHTEVDEQSLARTERDEQILAAPANRADGVPGQPRDEISRERLTQVRTTELDTIDPRATRRALQHPADRFDLWEFGHIRILMVAEMAEDTEYFNAGIAESAESDCTCRLRLRQGRPKAGQG